MGQEKGGGKGEERREEEEAEQPSCLGSHLSGPRQSMHYKPGELWGDPI